MTEAKRRRSSAHPPPAAVITSHLNADFDAFASMVAAGKLHPEAALVFSGSQEKQLREFLTAFSPAVIHRIRDIDFGEVRKLVIVDTKSLDRIGPFAELLQREDRPRVFLYDHHPPEKSDIRGMVEVFGEVGATATLFTEILKKEEIPLTPLEATILCLGIYEETGSLLFPTTTERDILAAAYLVRRGASLKVVASFIRADLSKDEFDLLNEYQQSAEDLEIDGTRIRVTRASREDYAGDAAHLAHRIMDMEDIDGLVLLLNTQGKILLVGRSRVPEFDVAELMRSFGGGGHAHAASATAKEASLEVVAEEVKSLVTQSVRKGKTADDVMTTPVITIEHRGSIKDAASTMTRYGVNVLPVLRDGQYLGIISRENIEKAIFHGFGRSPVSDFATTDALSVERATPVRDVERLMVEQNQRFMPVLEAGMIVGAITRTDILRTLYEDMLRRSRVKTRPEQEKSSSVGRNLASWLRERFPPAVASTLVLAGKAADELGFNAFLVGGSVRDLLRGEANLDIDIVVEGDGILFARGLAGKLGASMRSHERFGTAQIMSGTLKIDVATARTEYYESPAALPKVETSSIKKDLYRRDFTINTLAVKLNQDEFGMLIDFFGGQRDLREKTIRVLHNLSFVEDPTRAFRAVRFAERFGFKLSRHTENLLRSALRLNLFDRLSSSRLYEELLLIFRETEPIRAIRRLSDYGLLAVLHRSLGFSEKIAARLQALHDTLSWFRLLFLDERPDEGALYLMTLLSELSEEEREQALDRLAAPLKIRRRVTAALQQAKELSRSLPLGDAAKIHRTMIQRDLETLLFSMAVLPDDEKKKEISHFLLHLRNVKPLIRGQDLRKMDVPPGPEYSRILALLLEARLRGELKTREDEIAYVRRLRGQGPTEALGL